MKYILSGFSILVLGLGIPLLSLTASAQNSDDINGLEIIPKVDTKEIGKASERIGASDGETVRKKYNEEAAKLDTKEQFVSGIMTRATIMNYAAMLLRWLAQLGIAIGGLMFVYTGYLYVMDVIRGSDSANGKYIKNAVIGILVIIFSYAIMRILTRTFLS